MSGPCSSLGSMVNRSPATSTPVHLYFHAPCFDGVASAAIAAEYLSNGGRRRIELIPIGYESRGSWLSRSIGPQAAVVDFLFHPEAFFFADHHATTFLDGPTERAFEARKSAGAEVFYDPTAASCASLLVRELRDHFDVGRFQKLAQMADAVDSASYRTVEEAVFPKTVAGRLRDSLTLDPSKSFLVDLVQKLRRDSAEEIARDPEVSSRSDRYDELQREALGRFEPTLQWRDRGLVFFDYDASRGSVSRYAPYLFRPEARYSLGIIRSDAGAKITAMRNPWLDFRSAPLGRIFERYGGGGHERVGSVQLGPAESKDAHRVAEMIVRDVLAADRGEASCTADSTSTISTPT